MLLRYILLKGIKVLALQDKLVTQATLGNEDRVTFRCICIVFKTFFCNFRSGIIFNIFVPEGRALNGSTIENLHSDVFKNIITQLNFSIIKPNSKDGEEKSGMVK